MSKTKFTIDKEKLEVRAERVYKASAKRLFEAHSDPKQIPLWWGPARYKTTVDKLDFRVGGSWRFVQEGSGGEVHPFHGEYKEIDEPNKIVNTFEYEPVPGHVLIETVTFEEQGDGTTKLTATAHYENLADLEGMVAMGMENGEVEGHERLAKLVE